MSSRVGRSMQRPKCPWGNAQGLGLLQIGCMVWLSRRVRCFEAPAAHELCGVPGLERSPASRVLESSDDVFDRDSRSPILHSAAALRANDDVTAVGVEVGSDLDGGWHGGKTTLDANLVRCPEEEVTELLRLPSDSLALALATNVAVQDDLRELFESFEKNESVEKPRVVSHPRGTERLGPERVLQELLNGQGLLRARSLRLFVFHPEVLTKRLELVTVESNHALRIWNPFGHLGLRPEAADAAHRREDLTGSTEQAALTDPATVGVPGHRLAGEGPIDPRPSLSVGESTAPSSGDRISQRTRQGLNLRAAP